MKRLIILFLFPLQLFAQSSAEKDVTGVWTGFITTSEKKLPYEIVISEDKGKLNGYSHTTFNVNGAEIIAVKTIKIKNENGNILVEDEDLIANTFTNKAPKKRKQYNTLSLKTEDSLMILTGTFDVEKTREFRPASGNIRLQKKDTSAETKIIPKLKEMNLLASLSFLQPKIKEKEVIAVVTPPIEEPTIVQPKVTGIDVASAPVKINEASPVKPSNRKIEITIAPPVKAKEVQPVSQPKATEIVKAPPVKPAVQNPREIIAAAPAPVKKLPPPVLPKAKQIVASTPPVVKKPQPNVVVIAPPPVKRITQAAAVASTPDLSKRKIETIQGLYYKSDSLTLSLYDNGEVDGDSVSVIMNGRVIISKQGLSTNAVTKTIYITPDLGDSVQLIMYAENLGSIPPNTGLLILQDGNDRYEIRFAGDLTKNAAITLKKRKP